MPRPVFSYFGHDALGFLFRGWQWPSLSPVLQRGAESTKVASSDGSGEDGRSNGILGRLLKLREPQPLQSTEDRAITPITPQMAGIVNPLLFPESYMERWTSSLPQRSFSREPNIIREVAVSPPLTKRVSLIGRPDEPTALSLKNSETSESPNKSNVIALTSTLVGVVGALSAMNPAEQAAPTTEETNLVEEPVSSDILLESKCCVSDEEKASIPEVASTISEEEAPTPAIKNDSQSSEPEEKLLEPSADADGSQSTEVELTEETESKSEEHDVHPAKVPCKKDPEKCTHPSSKHIKPSKCSAALKKKGFAFEGPNTWLLCLECGQPWSDPTSAEVHASRSRHPLMLKCSDGTLICFECGNVDVTKSPSAQHEYILSKTDKIREMVQAKLKPTTLKITDLSSAVAPKASEPEEVKDSATPHELGGAPLGLKNLGNTCFFNSSLQMLAQSQRVQDALKDTSGHPLATALGKCLREIAGLTRVSNNTVVVERKTKKGSIRSAGPAISPSNLFSAVCRVAPHFSGFEQQDAQELMTFLLSGIEDEAGPNRVSEGGYEEKPTKPTPGLKWKMKHAEFWFGAKAKDVVQRTPVDEDDDVEPVNDQTSEEEDNDCDSKHPGDDVGDAECDKLAKDVNDLSLNDNKNETEVKKPAINLTKDVFQVDLDSIVRCDDCNAETTRRETQYMLSLALGDSTPSANPVVTKSVKGGRASKSSSHSSGSSSGSSETLQSCLDRFFAPERLLVSENNGFQCDKCARRKGQKSDKVQAHDATRQLSLSRVRDVLVLHFKRFHQVEGKKGLRAVKIDTHVRLDPILELPDGHGEMELVGIVEHLGSSLHGGHYVAYVRSGGGSPDKATWFRCSDDSVSKVSSSQVFDSAQVYLALYERR